MDLHDLRAHERILGHHGVGAAIPTRPSNAFLSVYPFDEWASRAVKRGVEFKDKPGTFDRESPGAVAVGGHFVRLGARGGARAGGRRRSEACGGFFGRNE